MKRRTFITTAPQSAAVLGGVAACSGDRGREPPGSPFTLAGKTLEELRGEYRSWLFDDYLPFLEKHVVDHAYGGFMCNTDRDGTNLSGDKRGWYEGRGIWVYSFLYNNFTRDQKHLDIAGKSVEFIMRHDPGRKGLWPERYSREGEPTGPPDMRGYGNLFIANGLAEFSKATGEEKYRTRAKEILLDTVEFFDRPDYYPEAARGSLGRDAPLIPGARMLGVWMVLIRLTTQMLASADDPEIRAVSDRAVEAVMKHHFNPAFDLVNEILNHDMSRPEGPVSQLVTAHAIETFWMIMYEAVRRRDKELYFTAAEWFRRHVEVFWDDVYGGVFTTLRNVDECEWSLSKALWAQEEVLIGFLCIVEHLGEQWARDWYGKMYGYVLDTFPLKPHGYPIWILSGDRKVTFRPHASRVGNFHHPRHLMLNILALDRMIGRQGAVSDIFSS